MALQLAVVVLMSTALIHLSELVGAAQMLSPLLAGACSASAFATYPPPGIGPLNAIPKALEKAHISKDDVDIYEINEAFGPQVGFPS